MGRSWSDVDHQFLRDNFLSMSNGQFAERFNRTKKAVNKKLMLLGLSRKKEPTVKIGQVFCRLTVVKNLGIIKRNNGKGTDHCYLCDCSCGVKGIETNYSRLKTGAKRSCGCLSRYRQNKSPGDVSWQDRFSKYKCGAKKRGIDFILTLSEFKEICSRLCYWCGEKPKPYNKYTKKDGSKLDRSISKESRDRAWIKTNGIDRKDNDLEYDIKNSIPCCTTCNRMKLDHTVKAFLLHCFKVIKYQKTVHGLDIE